MARFVLSYKSNKYYNYWKSFIHFSNEFKNIYIIEKDGIKTFGLIVSFIRVFNLV